MSNYKYKFTIISAVYNVSEFLAEAIESVVNQTIGIKNIQFILVDDGTPDNSGEICDEYAAKYPDNIFVIHKENGGVSSARNEGLKLVQGKYVNFMDSDDKWATDALSKVWDFFEAHYDETDMVALPIKFFDAARGDHMLNYKFNAGSRIVDLKTEWNTPQMHVASSFFKAELFENIRFDTRLAYAEDAKVVQEVIRSKQTIGLFNGSAFLYRKRSTGAASAIQSSGQKPNWYLPVMDNYHLDIIKNSLDEKGKLPRYIQMTLMYDLQWRLKKENIAGNNLTDDEKALYVAKLKEALGYIDDDIIMAQQHIWNEHKILGFKLKYSKAPELTLNEQGVSLDFSEDVKFPLSGCKATFEFIEVKENKLKLAACVGIYNVDYENLDFYFLVNGKRVDITDSFDRDYILCLDERMIARKCFNAEIHLEKGVNYAVKIAANINGQEVIFKKISFGQYAPLSNKYKRSYAVLEKRPISYTSDTLIVGKPALIKKLGKEARACLEIFKKDGVLGVGAAVLRILLHLYSFFKIKPIWLISDRASLAGDNGEALFRYLIKNHKNIDARFVLIENSADFERLKKVGPVLKRDSYKHKLLSAVSSAIISSHAEFEIFNPLRARVEPFRSFWTKSKFVFLQHGITQNDISGWIGKYNKNFTGIVAAAIPEYNSFLECDYRYDKSNIWLTGFPRFDRLEDSGEKRVTIMPTWRKYLTAGWNSFTDVWAIVDDFEQSDFYKFYNGLINSEKLISAAQKYGYSIDFFPHPTLQPHIDRFEKRDEVNFKKSGTAYKDIYSHSALLLTDYSSAAFDFAYLRKPVLYTHFDKDDFYGGDHICDDGYFDYERDGFGEVEYDLDSTVDRLVEYMENGCKLKDIYRERIDSFFAFNDKNNCQRVYEKIVEFSKK